MSVAIPSGRWPYLFNQEFFRGSGDGSVGRAFKHLRAFALKGVREFLVSYLHLLLLAFPYFPHLALVSEAIASHTVDPIILVLALGAPPVWLRLGVFIHLWFKLWL